MNWARNTLIPTQPKRLLKPCLRVGNYPGIFEFTNRRRAAAAGATQRRDGRDKSDECSDHDHG